MDLAFQFADRTRLNRRTAVRELLKLTAQPEMISFAGGLPASELFPAEQIRRAVEAVLSRHPIDALQYGTTEGVDLLRDWLAQRYSSGSLTCKMENVLIVSGGQQALDLIGRVFLETRDRVLVENPTYLALLSAWRPHLAEFVGLETDAHGLNPSVLDSLWRVNPKVLYCIPNFQNPSGATLVEERRRELIRRAAPSNLVIVEDDAYGDLRFEGAPLPSLLSLDVCQSGGINQSRILYVGTFSKILAPGLRVGWIIAAQSAIEKLTEVKQAMDLHTSTFNQHVICKLVRDDFLETHIPVLREEYRRRRDAMVEALTVHFPETAQWIVPAGGMFLFVTLPAEFNSAAILKESLREKVAFVPGDEFHLNGLGKTTMRLNFSNVGPARIKEGVMRLGEVIAARF